MTGALATSLDDGAARSIIVARQGGGYSVSVSPPHVKFPDEWFSDYRAARGFAGGVRLVSRWTIIDEAAG